MARKVLISFVGTGPFDENSKNSIREYKTAKYKFGSKEIETTFVASALTEFLECDTLFLFGTVKSMWEEVYNYYCKKNGLHFDEAYYYDIAEKCGETANSKTKLNKVNFQKISEVIGNNSKVIPIPYGLNQEEIEDIFRIFTDTLQENLKDGDQVYLDITHSFRSLPIYAQTTITFLTDVLGKDLEFKGIYYGMFEGNTELGYTPIVDLSYMLEIQKFIKGSYAFETTGNVDLLTRLLKERNANASLKLEEFSKVLSLNFVYDIKSQIAVLRSLSNDEDYQLPEKLIVPVAFKKFLKFFDKAKTLSDYQYLLAEWHFQKSAYALSYLCLIESLISYQLELNGKSEQEVKSEDNRNKVKGQLRADINAIYGPANQYRKTIAHVTEERQEVFSEGKRQAVGPKDAVINLEKYLKDFKTIRRKNNAH